MRSYIGGHRGVATPGTGLQIRKFCHGVSNSHRMEGRGVAAPQSMIAVLEGSQDSIAPLRSLVQGSGKTQRRLCYDIFIFLVKSDTRLVVYSPALCIAASYNAPCSLSFITPTLSVRFSFSRTELASLAR